MNSLKLSLFLTVLAVTLVVLPSAQATTTKHNDKTNTEKYTKTGGIKLSKEPPSNYLYTKKHPHHPPVAPWDNPRARMTCDKFPRVCHVKGSPGHDCCKKKCVNVKTDRLNCGMCGLKCRYPEICCNGRCINPFFDRHHCGGCDNKCNRGNFCYNGVCNYA